MKLHIITQKGTVDATQLVVTASWSGDKAQAARTLDIDLLSSTTDKSIPVVDCPVGAWVQFWQDTEMLFEGIIVRRQKSTDGNQIQLRCFDRGLYLKRNKELYKFTGTTPEDATKRITTDFGIEIGSLAKTNVKLSRLFLTGKDSLYDIIATMYTLASKTTDQQYHIGFKGKKLYVTVRQPDEQTLIIQGKSNLIAANTTESIEDIVTAVKIYDANNNFVREVQNTELLKLYGRMQDVLKQSKKDDQAANAQKILDNSGVSQSITVDNIGNRACVTGRTVVVQEPYTGLYGLFYIDSDTHTWKRGQYYNKLTLNFKNLMDEKEAGNLPNASGEKTRKKVSGLKPVDATDKWELINIPDLKR